MKVTGIAIVKQSFEVELDMTEGVFGGLSMSKQNELIKNAIDFKNTSVESVEIDDDIDISE
jgi:histone acetyltransferase (RNA polymerase elongator complex component)